MLSGEAISLPVLRECLLASTVEDLAKYRRCSPVDASDETDPRFWRDCVLQLFVHGNETIDVRAGLICHSNPWRSLHLFCARVTRELRIASHCTSPS
jgi:hypothetical protein